MGSLVHRSPSNIQFEEVNVGNTGELVIPALISLHFLICGQLVFHDNKYPYFLLIIHARVARMVLWRLISFWKYLLVKQFFISSGKYSKRKHHTLSVAIYMGICFISIFSLKGQNQLHCIHVHVGSGGFRADPW